MPGGQEAEINTAEKLYTFFCVFTVLLIQWWNRIQAFFKKDTLNIVYKMYWRFYLLKGWWEKSLYA